MVLAIKDRTTIFRANPLSMLNRFNLLAVAFFVTVSVTTYGQNKTLGVGTAAPNPNAALHVESPTNNQGFIMPRLTTAQRTGMSSLLTANDQGLMLYDTDLKTIYIWSGTVWKSTSEVAGGAKLSLPYADTVANAPVNSNLLRIVNTGTIAGGVGVAQFENLNPNSNFTTLFVRNAGSNSAGYFQMLTNTAPSAALRGITNSNAAGGHGVLGLTTGTGGSAGYFQVNNAASGLHSLQGITNGTGSGLYGENKNISGTTSHGVQGVATAGGNNAGVYGKNIGGGTAVMGETSNGWSAIFGYQHSPFGWSGNFEIDNATNTWAALNAFTSGTGNGATFSTTNPANTSAAILGNTEGAGPGVRVNQSATSLGSGLDVGIQNTASTATGLNINQNGNGYAVYSKSTGTNENAWFEVSNPASSGSPVVGITNGTGVAGYFQVNNPTSGTSAVNGITNSNLGGANAPVGVYGTSSGTGSLGGSFRNTNPANTFPALYSETKGLSNTAAFKTKNPANNFPALYVETDGTGGAANFTTLNAGSSSPGVMIAYAGTGNALFTTGKIQAGQFVGDGSLLTNLPGGGGGWGLTGNAATNSATNFIGTTDSKDFAIRTNNTEVIKLFANGQIGIGSTPVSAKLDLLTSSNTIGIYSAVNTSTAGDNRALQGNASGSAPQNFGVYGTGVLGGSSKALGVYGEAIGTGTGDAIGLYGSVNNFTSTTGTTYGLYATAENGSTNWAGFFDKGNVHIKNGLSVGATPGTFGTAGQVLTSQGNAAPTWSPISLGANSVTTLEIALNTIENKNISPTAFIAGSKIDPNFGSQNVTTSGNFTVTSAGKFIGDGSGLTNLPSSGWGLSGNSLSGIETIGSDNFQPLVFETNNTERMRIDANGKVGIGTAPSYPLDVAGTVQIVNTSNGLRAMEVTSTTGDAINVTANGTVNTKGVQSTVTVNGNYATGLLGTAVSNDISFGVSGAANGTGNFNYGVQAVASGSASVNYGVYGNSVNGGTNWAGYFDQGNVHIKNALSVGAIDGTFGTSGQILTSQGGGTAPVWSSRFVSNLTNAFAAIDVIQSGSGGGAVFQIANGGNSVASLAATTNGTGAAFDADQTGNGFGITVKSKNTDAIHATKLAGDGIGSAGFFSNAEPGNVASTVYATTNSSGAPALGLANTAGGNALAMFSGGMQLSALTVSVGGTITTKAGLYEVTTVSGVTLPVSGNVGETCWVAAIGVTATVNSVNTVSSGTIRQFIRLTGGWQIVN
jgi:hypothetical protein